MLTEDTGGHDDGADPGGGAAAVAEGARVIPEERFDGWSPTWMLGHRITGKSDSASSAWAAIRTALAPRQGLRLSIHYHNRRASRALRGGASEADVLWTAYDQMLARYGHRLLKKKKTGYPTHLLSRACCG